MLEDSNIDSVTEYVNYTKFMIVECRGNIREIQDRNYEQLLETYRNLEKYMLDKSNNFYNIVILSNLSPDLKLRASGYYRYQIREYCQRFRDRGYIRGRDYKYFEDLASWYKVKLQVIDNVIERLKRMDM